MKSINVSKNVLILFVTGLLLTSLTPIVNRYFPMPDVLEGFLRGVGIAIEVIALIKMEKNKKKSACA